MGSQGNQGDALAILLFTSAWPFRALKSTGSTCNRLFTWDLQTKLLEQGLDVERKLDAQVP
ncbi:MAG: hypothetical protein Q8K00_04220, partial [Syntrophales bacterium]|nr:hypothetical protein [Syntrophales bacterium]